MRSAVAPQLPLCAPYGAHKHADLLRRISLLLDQMPELSGALLCDLVPAGTRADFGRQGLSAEQVLRILVLYLMLQTDFEQLEFHLSDSPAYRAFCRLELGQPGPKRSTLQANVSRVRPQTLQQIHKLLVQHAVHTGVEPAERIRTDTTPVAAAMRAPTDARLLGDAVRVLSRLLKKAQEQIPFRTPNHGRRVRRRVLGIHNAKSEEERTALYEELIEDTKEYAEAALFAAKWLEGVPGRKMYLLSLELVARAECALRIVDQAERRVLEGEQVPAEHKVLSLFETHADLLCKRKQIVYGHKVCLSFGRSGVVLQAEILRGNPADATQAVPAVKQVKAATGKTPSQVAMDTGFAAKKNLQELKQMGVQQVGFTQGRGQSAEAMCGSREAHRKLRRFRAGVEGQISWLKRSLSMGQSRWKGEPGFWSYVLGIVVTASLVALAQSG